MSGPTCDKWLFPVELVDVVVLENRRVVGKLDGGITACGEIADGGALACG